jgi:hypothetical protein
MPLVVSIAGLGQTKSETIDWINAKSPNNPILFGSIIKESQKFKINPDASFFVTAIIYELPIDPKSPKAETTTTLKGDFKNLNPSAVRIRKEGNLIFIDVKCNSNKGCLQVDQKGRSGVDYDNSGVAFGPYYDNEENLPERLKKAFTQLIILCGGKKEAY